jgi:osmotically-inducible protein OsmY
MTDHGLRQRVENALEFVTNLDATKIAVAVDRGVATLSGGVSSYAEKINAERIARCVFGVKAVANDLDVGIGEQAARTDTDIAQAAADALRCNAGVPPNRVRVVVDAGWVTVNGTVAWPFQRTAAEACVRMLRDVRGVTNDILLDIPMTGTEVPCLCGPSLTDRRQHASSGPLS